MKTVPTVEKLRQNQYKVRVHHRRLAEPVFHDEFSVFNRLPKSMKERLADVESVGCTFRPATRGGTTVVEITSPDGQTFTGEAECSRKDTYNKKRGVLIAIGRAFADAGREFIDVQH